MDGNIQKALWLGVSILIFVAVVMIGMSVFTSGQEMAAEGAEQLDNTTRELSNAQYSMYDNKEVSGSDVISAINRYKQQSGEIQVVVTNNSGTTTTYVSSGDPAAGTLGEIALGTINTSIQNAQDKSQTTLYINPYGEFYATLIYDVNDQVRGVDFDQQ